MFREERKWGENPGPRTLSWPTTILAVSLIIAGGLLVVMREVCFAPTKHPFTLTKEWDGGQ